MEKAEEWFERILKVGLTPGLMPYTSLVSGHCRLQNFEKAESWLKRSREAGLPSDSVMYSALIDGYANEGSAKSMKRAGELFEAMISSGVRPNPRVAVKLLREHAKRGDLVEATHYADRMEASGLKVGRSEYLHLLKACTLSSVNDRASVAEKLLRQMVADGFPPDDAMLQKLEPLLGRRGREICKKTSSTSPSAKSRPAKKQSKATTAALADLLGAAKKRRPEAEQPVPSRWSERCGETVKLLQAGTLSQEAIFVLPTWRCVGRHTTAPLRFRPLWSSFVQSRKRDRKDFL